MKKKLIICALALAAIMVVGGCGKKDTEATTVAETTTVASDSADVQDASALVKPENYGSVDKLGVYKGVEIAVEDTTVTDEEVQAEIDNQMANNPETTEITDRAAVNGDIVNIDYEGKMDGVAFDGGTAQGYDLTLGSGSFISGFEDQLVGANIGDTVLVNVTFPEDYGSTDLAGKPAEFTVKINSIKEEKPVTELTPEWISMVTSGAATDESSYRAYVRETLESTKKANAESQGQYAALTAVMDGSEITANQEAIDYEYNMQLSQVSNMAAQYGTDLTTLANAYGFSTEEDLKNELMVYADEVVKQQLIIDAIFDAENMTLNDDDYNELATMYSSTKDDLINNYGQEVVDNEAKPYKVIKFIYDNAKKTVEETTAAETTTEETAESSATAQ